MFQKSRILVRVKEAIAQRARELGFGTCRFTTADPPATAHQFAKWIEQGRHGEMNYLQRNAHKRVDPQAVLAGAKTVIVLAASYHSNGPGQHRLTDSSEFRTRSAAACSHPPDPSVQADFQPRGVVARYAQHSDYHDVLGERLRQLTDYLSTLGSQNDRSLWYVDTGPVLERDFGERAGVGFIGKHTNLISRQLGNWFFLAEIITTIELTPDPPEHNRCGSCTRCITACPTGAITAPFQMDARRCISYLTIELKGAIPTELRPAIGNRIYGCDDCLAACPWNRFARQARLMADQSRPELAQPDLIEILGLDNDGFKRRFAGTPMLRTKRRGLLRNVCVALGNIGDARALPALERAMNDSEPLIAEHARWAIRQITVSHSPHGQLTGFSG